MHYAREREGGKAEKQVGYTQAKREGREGTAVFYLYAYYITMQTPFCINGRRNNS